MRELLTPKQVAQAMDVSEASLKRWCDKGFIPATRTPGGHRRLPLPGVLEFLRKSGRGLIRPEVLGLPSAVGKGRTTFRRAGAQMRNALVAGDEEQFTRLAFDLYVGGASVLDICQKALTPALHAIGADWQHGEVEIFEERRACELSLRVLHRLRRVLPQLPSSAPVAIGGTPAKDAYTLPTTMVEVVLREEGWNAELCGTNLPAETCCEAIDREQPLLFWLSVSYIDDLEEFLVDYEKLYEKASSTGVALAVGGAALEEEVRERMRYSAYCDTLGSLVSFVRTLHTPDAPG